MSKPGRIQKQILEIKSQLTERSSSYRAVGMFETGESEVLKSKLEELETERRFILDYRESWVPKTLWNLFFPIIVAFITTLFTLWLTR
ncbi:MAG: hypothetical protein A3K16_05640 [Omnitrophica bacterium RIFCSPLOWO2_01_FULL_45_24]|uniref:Uncharacterized protein n=1 Tax=Candidatus Uhrbacteria bacterium RIFCSPLOWO2_02_FULL_48_12 TaxID=1802407 RepID=A0A1F7VAF0_9BACT|nr:MAG: hypothetical protein A3I40_02565 [Candidatus Uhrbacteria bacterium RIFCSPLOWO2_02_FULL_48_12]OGW93867.1 MAG: hypothetical protein A3K16_05640 [Omnitrophica bacterium RIFCSPLOWO2_01_FULL_45_24]